MKSSLVESLSYPSATDHTWPKIALSVVQHKTIDFLKNVLRVFFFNHIVTSMSSIDAIILQCQEAEWTNLADLLMTGLNMNPWQTSSFVSALFLISFYYRFADFNQWHREINISTSSMRETLSVQLHIKILLLKSVIN